MSLRAPQSFVDVAFDSIRRSANVPGWSSVAS